MKDVQVNNMLERPQINVNQSELVFGLAGAVGTNTKSVVGMIKTRLSNFGYQVKEINISSFLSVFADKNDGKKTEELKEFERLTRLMDTGDKLRKENDNGFLAMYAIDQIQRGRTWGHKGEKEPAPQAKIAYIIWLLKNPAEVELLRAVYGTGFYLIGIFEEQEKREQNLNDRKGKIDAQQLNELFSRDEEDIDISGQQNRATYQLADFFVNLSKPIHIVEAEIFRFINLIFGEPFMTPTFGEYAMFMAYSTSLRSADLSRQIGAVICRDDEILSLGANDCPKVGGGLFWIHHNPNARLRGDVFKDEDYGRDYLRGKDANKEQFLNIVKAIFDEFDIEFCPENVRKAKNTPLGNLTEYGRAVHAEIEALACCARNNISCRDAVVYVTTYPCHNCAKHLIAAGIKKIIYIEAYPKSKTEDFYGNLFNVDTLAGQAESTIPLVPFFGVGPRRFIDFFAMDANFIRPRIRKGKESNNLKEYGKVIRWNEDKATVRSILDPQSYLDREMYFSIYYNSLLEKYLSE